MRPIIVAWQMGTGRGHIAAIKRVATALGPTFEIDAALAAVDYAEELSGLFKYIYPSASLSLSARAYQRAVSGASWGQYLGDVGFDDVERLKTCFDWWHQTFIARKPALVVCDYAPVAQWTAHCMGIPVVSVGTAFGQPNAQSETFPQMLPDHDGWPHNETDLVENVNRATTALGFKKLERLPQLYAVNKQLLMSFPALDPYNGAQERGQYVSPVPTLNGSENTSNSGEEIFVYFSTTETNNQPLMHAICSLDLPVAAYIPNITNEMAEDFLKAGVRLLSSAAAPNDIKQKSRMMLHAGQHGIMSLGMALGLQQFAVPQQLEQLFHARRAADLGCLAMPHRTGVSAEEFRENIRAAYLSEKMAVAAKNIQRDLQPSLPLNATVQLRRALEPLLPAAFSL